jgi:hypothetical protein
MEANARSPQNVLAAGIAIRGSSTTDARKAQECDSNAIGTHDLAIEICSRNNSRKGHSFEEVRKWSVYLIRRVILQSC